MLRADGEGVSRNDQEALEYYHLSAKQGHQTAIDRLTIHMQKMRVSAPSPAPAPSPVPPSRPVSARAPIVPTSEPVPDPDTIPQKKRWSFLS